MAPKTLSTYLTALSYVYKIQSLPDPTSAFLISKLVAGAYRLKPLEYIKLPLTFPILNILVSCLPFVTTFAYEKSLFGAMFLFAYNSFAGIGEITVNQADDKVLVF